MSLKTLHFHYLSTEAELTEFWSLRDHYMTEDIIPACEPPMTEEERDWFFSSEYRDHMESLFRRETDPLQIARLTQNGEYAGFLVYIIYGSEDGKCFIVDYCINKALRGHGLGSRFFRAFEQEAAAKGSAYLALHVSNKQNRKFWERLGFVKGADDEYGNPVYYKNP